MDYPTFTDEELVRLVKKDNEQAFEILFHRYERRIQGYTKSILKNHADAEEVTNDVFLRVFLNIRRYDPGKGRFKSWIYAIARNAALDRKRTNRARQEREISFDSRLIEYVVGPQAPMTETLLSEHWIHVSGVLQELSGTEQRVLMAKLGYRLKHKDIAQEFGKTEAWSRQVLRRARKKFASAVRRNPELCRLIGVEPSLEADGKS